MKNHRSLKEPLKQRRLSTVECRLSMLEELKELGSEARRLCLSTQARRGESRRGEEERRMGEGSTEAVKQSSRRK